MLDKELSDYARIKNNNMQYCGMQLERPERAEPETAELNLSPPELLEYIKELKTSYEERLNKIQADANDYQRQYLELKEKYDLLIYKRYMRSAEQLAEAEMQPQLFSDEGEAEPEAPAGEAGVEQVASYRRKKPGRKPLPAHLERRERVIDIPETEKTCPCGTELTKIGEEVCERLQIIPPQIYVEKIIRPKYACRACEGTEDEEHGAVHIAPVEPSIIPKSIASASLLSWIITEKFEDHAPYNGGRITGRKKCLTGWG